MITLAEAKDFLHIDQDLTDNDILIQSLLDSIPNYIEVQTGLTAEDQENEPMAKTATGFILHLWYFAEKAEEPKLTRVINSLLKCITLKHSN